MKKPVTLKAKLTLAHAVGFFLSLSVCFAAIYAVQRHMLNKGIREKLLFYVSEFTYEYLAATEFTPQHALIDPRKLPEASRQLLQRRHPGVEILSAVRTPGRNVEVIGIHGGQTLLLTLSPDLTRLESGAPIPDVDRVAHMMWEFNEESYGEGQNKMFFLLLSPDGRLLARSPFHESHLPKILQHNLKLMRAGPSVWKNPRFSVTHTQGIGIRVLRHAFPDGNVLILGTNLSEYDKNLNRLLAIFGLSLLAMPALSLGIGYCIAAKVSNAIHRVTSAAREIEASGDYSKRVCPGGEGLEIDRLADAFNGMTGKTERLLGELKTISENIAHDLRTPLTRMRGKAELALYAEGDPEFAGVVAEECGDMLEMINTTLDITQAEYHFDASRMTRLDLRLLLLRSLELFSTLAEDKQITLSSDLPEPPVPFTGHASKLQRMVANLLDNAIKFTPRGGGVTLALAQTPDAVTLTVSDTGCGIPASDLSRVFDRFYRSSASRTLPGNGLGLCLVRAIAAAHRGEVGVASTPGKGTVFTLRFPAAAS